MSAGDTRRDFSVDVERSDGVGLVTINRPAVLNALTPELLEAIIGALEQAGDAPEVGAIVLAGEGRSFMAGADVHVMDVMSVEEMGWFFVRIQDLTRLMRRLSVPVIAALQGPVVGGGCEIACACDLRIAAASATFSFPEVRYGMVVTSGATYLLPELVGMGWAKRLLFEGQTIDADHACRIGLVEDVVPDDKLRGASLDVARRIAAGDRLTVALTKQILNSYQPLMDTALDAEIEADEQISGEGRTKERLGGFVRGFTGGRTR